MQIKLYRFPKYCVKYLFTKNNSSNKRGSKIYQDHESRLILSTKLIYGFLYLHLIAVITCSVNKDIIYSGTDNWYMVSELFSNKLPICICYALNLFWCSWNNCKMCIDKYASVSSGRIFHVGMFSGPEGCLAHFNPGAHGIHFCTRWKGGRPLEFSGCLVGCLSSLP